MFIRGSNYLVSANKQTFLSKNSWFIIFIVDFDRRLHVVGQILLLPTSIFGPAMNKFKV